MLLRYNYVMQNVHKLHIRVDCKAKMSIKHYSNSAVLSLNRLSQSSGYGEALINDGWLWLTSLKLAWLKKFGAYALGYGSGVHDVLVMD